MDSLRIHHDPKGHTLTVWFDDPEREHLAEETSDDVILIKDVDGKVIGFERLNYHPGSTPLRVDLSEAEA